jgi:hypothetical protein
MQIAPGPVFAGHAAIKELSQPIAACVVVSR